MARLPRLPAGTAIVDPKTGMPTLAFTAWWQKVVSGQEATDAAQDAATEELAAQLLLIQAAQGTADAAAREAARLSSYPVPTSNLSAADAGSDASITVASHTRVYPVQGTVDVPDVAITGGTITGLAFSTQYAVYYDDPTLEDTTPTFVATTSIATAQLGAGEGRHFVGTVTTPADGGGSTSGSGSSAPGYGSPIP